LETKGKELKQREIEVGFYRKIPVRCLDPVSVPDTGDLGSKRLLLHPSPHMLNHRVRENDFKTLVGKGEPATITSDIKTICGNSWIVQGMFEIEKYHPPFIPDKTPQLGVSADIQNDIA
jgi:hypothetical protein